MEFLEIYLTMLTAFLLENLCETPEESLCMQFFGS